MAAGVSDLGNGIGYIYKTKVNGSTIVGVERNTNQGVQAMIQNGVGSAPISAQRSAYATITVSASGGTGSITSIDVLGVNQIGAPIVVTSTNLNTVALQIVAAINSYSVFPGLPFTANKPFTNLPIVYIYSAPANGTAVNGATPIIAATDPGLQFSTTDFINGSNDNGVFDDQFGYRFWLYADALAVPDLVDPLAIEITKFIVLRGSNTGIITTNRTLGTGGTVNGINRACDSTQVILDTGGPPLANCGFIETIDFVEGDIIRVRNSNPARVPVMQDASVSTSPTPNLYLTDAAPFALTGFNSINLQYRFDNTLGPIWVETGRSITATPNITTLGQFILDSNGNVLQGGKVYFIQDLGYGAYVDVINSQDYNPIATWIRRIPTGYTSCWRSNMAAPIVGQNYRHRQLVYTSLTGNVGSAPNTDVINWQLVPTSNPSYYAERYNPIVIQPIASNLIGWPVIEEKDEFGNQVKQSQAHFASSGVNAFDVFCWSVGPGYYGNYVQNSVFDVSNSDGQVYNNVVTSNTNFSNNRMMSTSVVATNTFVNSTITDNYITFLAENIVYNGTIQQNGTSTNAWPEINANVIYDATIFNNTGTTLGASIIGNQLAFGSKINNNQCGQNGKIRYNILDSGCGIEACILNNLTPSADIESNHLMGTSQLILKKNLPAGWVFNQCVLNNSDITINSNFSSNNISGATFTNCTILDWQECQAINNCVFENLNVTGPLYCDFDNTVLKNWTSASAFFSPNIQNCIVIVGQYSNLEEFIDTSDPSIYAAGVLTIPYNKQLAGVIRLDDTALSPAVSISNIVDLPKFKNIQFTNVTSGLTAYTFVVTPLASVVSFDIIGTGNFTLNSTVGTNISDYLIINDFGGILNNITVSTNFI